MLFLKTVVDSSHDVCFSLFFLLSFCQKLSNLCALENEQWPDGGKYYVSIM